MNAKVIKPFFDLSNPSDVYAVGDTFEGTDERVADLARRGFVKPLDPEPEPEPDPEPEEKPAPKSKAKKKAAKE
jgi:hypothetical protein